LNYYVYYKLAPERVAGLRASVQRLFDKIEAELGVRGRWMRRRDDPTTYMEVYEDVKNEQAFEALLAREGPALGPERRVERFVQA
jgi:hypothetical protein